MELKWGKMRLSRTQLSPSSSLTTLQFASLHSNHSFCYQHNIRKNEKGGWMVSGWIDSSPFIIFISIRFINYGDSKMDQIVSNRDQCNPVKTDGGVVLAFRFAVSEPNTAYFVRRFKHFHAQIGSLPWLDLEGNITTDHHQSVVHARDDVQVECVGLQSVGCWNMMACLVMLVVLEYDSCTYVLVHIPTIPFRQEQDKKSEQYFLFLSIAKVCFF